MKHGQLSTTVSVVKGKLQCPLMRIQVILTVIIAELILMMMTYQIANITTGKLKRTITQRRCRNLKTKTHLIELIHGNTLKFMKRINGSVSHHIQPKMNAEERFCNMMKPGETER